MRFVALARGAAPSADYRNRTVDEQVARILDANLNRVREGLRVLEDYARFALDDAHGAALVKDCRHLVRAVRDACGSAQLLAARHIDGDIGRDLKTPDEVQRSDAQAVAIAAFGRVQEAARSLGEYAKLVSADAANTAERLRYQAYSLEEVLIGRGALRQRFRAAKLYVLITAELCRRGWLETARDVLRAGADCLQLREKILPDQELLRRASLLREMTHEHGALLIINDRPDIARLSDADGVHLGQDDLSVDAARRVLGCAGLVGKSTHSLQQVNDALREAPDYLAVGPMHPSMTKPQDHVPGPSLLAAARERTELPIVAIGGITTDNAGALLAQGASAVAVCSAVIAADDPATATRTLSAR